jgi:CubicO group peptidase (beta-lactamase class C family)
MTGMKKIYIILFMLVMEQSTLGQSFNPNWADRFQEVLDSVRISDSITGAAAAVFTPGEGIWSGISGNSMPGVPLTQGMRFGIASNTKLFIAVTLLKLQEQNVLSLDDHLCQWIPSFPNVDSNITIRQLLSHQSGIFNFSNNVLMQDSVLADTAHFWTLDEVMEYVLAPDFEPGAGWRYSNTNYIIAGMIIEEASGMPWVQKVHETIFDPLGMDSTFVGAFENAGDSIACFQYFGNTGPWYTYPVTSFFSSAGPAGAIFSTPGEMVQWYHALFQGEILSGSSLQQLLDYDVASFYGLAVIVDADESLRYPWYQHTGWGFTYMSMAVFDLKTQSSFFFITNTQIDDFFACIHPLMKVLYNEYPQKPDDAAITHMLNPQDHVCTGTVIPQVMLRNCAGSPLTSVTISCQLDGGTPSVYPWTGSLSPGDTVLVTLDSIDPANGSHILTVYSSDPNNAPDGYPYNDTLSVHFVSNLQPAASFPFFEDFEDPGFPPDEWISEPDLFTQWGRTALVAYSGDACAVKNNYWDLHSNARYNMDLPLIDLSGINNGTLSFHYAYAPCSPVLSDTLGVFISADCGSTWDTLFYSGGYQLGTAPWTSVPFFPKASQWDNLEISLAGYSGGVLIRFQNVCGFGNNLFLDDIQVGWPVGSQDLANRSGNLKIYPNPATTVITAESGSCGTLAVFTLNGQEILQKELNGQITTIDISTLPPGIYVVKVVGNKGVQVGKFIKQ